MVDGKTIKVERTGRPNQRESTLKDDLTLAYHSAHKDEESCPRFLNVAEGWVKVAMIKIKLERLLYGSG